MNELNECRMQKEGRKEKKKIHNSMMATITEKKQGCRSSLKIWIDRSSLNYLSFTVFIHSFNFHYYFSTSIVKCK